AVAARLVLNHEALFQPLAQPIGGNARDQVDRAAGRGGHDDGGRAGGVGARGQRGERRGENQKRESEQRAKHARCCRASSYQHRRIRYDARAYWPRPKKRSLLSSVAVSRLDLMSACLAIMVLIAGRADSSLKPRLMAGFSSILTPWAACWRVHGNVAMSAIEYSSPPRYFA